MELDKKGKKRILKGLIDNLKDESSPELNMRWYVQNNVQEDNDKVLISIVEYNENKNRCGTTMCVAGRIPLVDKAYADSFRNKKNQYWFKDMADGLGFNKPDDNDDLCFLFSGCWPNDREQAIKRIEYYIEHEEIHPDFRDNPNVFDFKLVL